MLVKLDHARRGENETYFKPQPRKQSPSLRQTHCNAWHVEPGAAAIFFGTQRVDLMVGDTILGIHLLRPCFGIQPG